MFAHFDGLTLLSALASAALVSLAFIIYSNRGILPRYTVRRGSRVVSRHYTQRAANDYHSYLAGFNSDPTVFQIMGR